jgi:hypothetical protein
VHNATIHPKETSEDRTIPSFAGNATNNLFSIL